MNKISVVFIFVSCNLCCGQVLQFGSCPEIESMKYFEVEKFLGTWYEMQRFPTWYEDYGQCAYKIFDYCGRRLEISHGYVKDGVEYVLHVNTTYAPGDEAVLTIPKSNIDPVGIPLVVVDTDYKEYAVVYGCKSNDKLHIKYISAWILSRSYSLDEETLSKARDVLVKRTSSSVVYLEKIYHNPELCNSYWTAHVQAQYYNITEDDDVEGRRRIKKYYQSIDEING